MDDITKRSKLTMGNAKRVNQKLERDLLMTTKIMSKNIELIKKERMGIVTTRRNITEGQNAWRKAPDISQLSKLTINSKDERRRSISLTQSKLILNTAIERARKFNFLCPNITGNGFSSWQTDENYEERQSSLPFITQLSNNCITETALENRKEIDSCEKVLRYIQMQNAEMNINETSSSSISDEEDSSLDCQTPQPSFPTRKKEISKSENNNPEYLENKVKNVMSNATTICKSANQPRNTRQKILNRRHSVLGVTLNVPVVIPDTGNFRSSSKIGTDYGESPGGENCKGMKSNVALSANEVDIVVPGEEGKSTSVSKVKSAMHRRKSLPHFSPVPPPLVMTKADGKQRTRRSSLPNIPCAKPTMFCMQKIRENPRDIAILEESTHEDLLLNND